MRMSLVSIKKSGVELIDDDRHIERGGKPGDLADFRLEYTEPVGLFGIENRNTRAPASNAALSFARSSPASPDPPR
jgi:hypothetical protein